MRRVMVVALSALMLLAALPGTGSVWAMTGPDTSANASLVPRPAPVPMEKFVLQVGIDDYQHAPKLLGCLADLERMRGVLTGHFAVRPDHIKTLRDAEATHEAIIQAFRSQLIDNAKNHPDALVIFEYSGHGSRVDDQNGDKVDHLDSTLVPVDSRDEAGRHFDIVDDEIRDLFNELTRYTTNVLFILDCCNSGNPTRGGEQTRGIPKDDRPQPPERPFAGARGGRLKGQDMVGLLPRDERYVSIAATLPAEYAGEISTGGGPGGGHEGRLTHSLADSLEHAKPETTYRDLMAQVANDVSVQSLGTQHPQVEGDLGRFVMGGSADREDPFIKIKQVSGNRITIDAGKAEAMTEGTILSIYASDAHDLSGPNKRLANARVVQVDDLASTAELLLGSSVPADSKVVVLSRDFGSTRTRVLMMSGGPGESGSDPASRVISDVAEYLKDNKAVDLLWFRPNSANGNMPPTADAALMRGRFGSVFPCRSSLAPRDDGRVHSAADDAEIFYLTGPDRLTPLFGFEAEPKEPDAVQRIANAIEHLANQRALLAVNNATSDLNGQLALRVIKVYGERDDQGILKPGSTDRLLELGKMDQDYHFDQGEMFKFQIENHSPRDLYIVLFDISTDGAIQILYPPLGAKGMKLKSHDPIPLVIPQVFATTGPPGYETFKVIATTVETLHDNFAFLEQNAVRGPRSVPVSVQELPEWTTTQINFVISDRVVAQTKPGGR
ncbi:MAG TPA: caspase family protein [Blastocatellia bacterium]